MVSVHYHCSSTHRQHQEPPAAEKAFDAVTVNISKPVAMWYPSRGLLVRLGRKQGSAASQKGPPQEDEPNPPKTKRIRRPSSVVEHRFRKARVAGIPGGGSGHPHLGAGQQAFDGCGADAGDTNGLLAAGLTAHDGHRRARHIERLGQHAHHGRVGLAIHRGRVDGPRTRRSPCTAPRPSVELLGLTAMSTVTAPSFSVMRSGDIVTPRCSRFDPAPR